jgi:hypothetical protein
MCTICDGATVDEVSARHHDDIETRGFSGVIVESPNSGRGGWAYTIGLAARGHPELVVANAKPKTADSVLGQLARWVCAGDVFSAGDCVPVSDDDLLTFVRVHPRQLRGDLLASWHHYYDWLGVDPPPLDALQVLLPPSLFCAHHRRSQPRLDLPGDYAARCVADDRPPRRRRRKAKHRR